MPSIPNAKTGPALLPPLSGPGITGNFFTPVLAPNLELVRYACWIFQKIYIIKTLQTERELKMGEK